MNRPAIPSNPAELSGPSQLDEHDRLILQNVDRSLQESLELQRWWEKKNASQDFAQRFDLIQSFNRPTQATGFFDSADLGRKTIDVMGVVQEMLYDRADTGAVHFLKTIRDEFREFILQYFMRISDFRRPQAAVDPASQPAPFAGIPLSWCPRTESTWRGFGYSQHYYKLRDSRTIGKFNEAERYAIVDLRGLETTYEWIVAKVQIFDFQLNFAPLGTRMPSLSFPLKEETYLILHRDFITNNDSPEGGAYCEYGFGYGILSLNDGNSILAYGPSNFGVGLQKIAFRMLSNGETRVQLTFIVNRPERLLNVPLDPLQWGFAFADLASLGGASNLLAPLKETLQSYSPSLGTFDPVLTYISLANLLTAGQAAKQLCISKEQLEKEMLVQHFMQHYEMIVGSLLTWRQIPDWLDRDNLPSWITHGVAP